MLATVALLFCCTPAKAECTGGFPPRIYERFFHLDVQRMRIEFPFSSGELWVPLKEWQDGHWIANVHDDGTNSDYTFEVFMSPVCEANNLGQVSYEGSNTFVEVGQRLTLRGALGPGYPETNLGATSYLLRLAPTAAQVLQDFQSTVGSQSGDAGLPWAYGMRGSLQYMLISLGIPRQNLYQVGIWSAAYFDGDYPGTPVFPIVGKPHALTANHADFVNLPPEAYGINQERVFSRAEIAEQLNAQREAESALEQRAAARYAAEERAAAARYAAEERATAVAREKARKQYIRSFIGDYRNVIEKEHGNHPCHIATRDEDGLHIVVWQFCTPLGMHYYRFIDGKLQASATEQ
ncbi:MAG: hypothetical protein ACYCUI_10180 [Vulcanimicrobiaceae bacterium]